MFRSSPFAFFLVDACHSFFSFCAAISIVRFKMILWSFAFFCSDITLQVDQSNNRGKQNSSFNIAKYNVSKEQIELLQAESKTVLTEKLLKKVLETETVSNFFVFCSKTNFFLSIILDFHVILQLSFLSLLIYSLVTSFIHPFIHSHIQSFIRSFSQSFIHSFIHSLVHPPFQLPIHSFTHSFIHPFIHPFTHFSVFHSFTHSFFRSFSHSSTHSFIASFIHSSPYSSIHPSIHPFFHSSIHSVIRSLSYSFIYSFIHSFSQSVSQSVIHSFIHSFAHSYIHSFIFSFVNSLFHLSFLPSIHLPFCLFISFLCFGLLVYKWTFQIRYLLSRSTEKQDQECALYQPWSEGYKASWNFIVLNSHSILSHKSRSPI